MSTASLTRPDALQPDPASTVQLASERACDGREVDALIERAFGPGRYAKTAERLREGAAFHPELSVCAWRGRALLGAVRLWPARIGSASTLFLGPIAVERALRGHGLGGELVEAACRRAKAVGEPSIILVGDLGFFGPLGFEAVPSGRVTLPGPVDPRRLLWTALIPQALDEAAGRLTVLREA